MPPGCPGRPRRGGPPARRQERHCGSQRRCRRTEPSSGHGGVRLRRAIGDLAATDDLLPASVTPTTVTVETSEPLTEYMAHLVKRANNRSDPSKDNML